MMLMEGAVNLSAYNLTTPYSAVALYYSDADTVEYIRRDEPAVYRRVDELLTLIFSMESREELIGFQLKGFRNFYLQDRVRERLGDDFMSLVGLLERAVTTVAEGLFDEKRRVAYDRAHKIALEDRVALHDFPTAVAR